jgi:hypothetical protein
VAGPGALAPGGSSQQPTGTRRIFATSALRRRPHPSPSLPAPNSFPLLKFFSGCKQHARV